MKIFQQTLIPLFLLLVACSTKEAPVGNLEVTSETKGVWVDEETYKNDFFGFEFHAPQGWVLQKAAPSPKEVIDDSLKGQQVKAAMDMTYMPLTVKRSFDGGESFNVVIENVSGLAIDSIEDYMKMAIESLHVVKGDLQVYKQEKKCNYLGVEWSILYLKTQYNNFTFYQRVYGTLKEGNVLLINITEFKKDSEELDEVITSSFSFEK